MSLRWGWKVYGSALVMVAAAGMAAMTPTRPAGATPNFRGAATADAVRVSVTVPNAPATSSIVDGGAWSAQAVVTSAGTSQAYASNPYPGETVVTLPGTLAGFGVPGVPQYPLYAGSMHPDTPHAEIGSGPFHLVADSAATTSDASTTSGQSGEQQAGLGAATASVHQEGDGSVVSRSESRVDGFTAGPLRIGSIVSGATTKLPAAGDLERSSRLEVTGLAVNDVAARLTPEGLVAADQTVPLDPQAIAEALAKANVSISYITAEETPNGIVGAGVRVTSSVEVPGSGPSQATWVFGRSLALIDSAEGDSSLLPDLPLADFPNEAPAPASASAAPVASPPADAGAFSAGLDSTPAPGSSSPFSLSPSGFGDLTAIAPAEPAAAGDAAGQAALSPVPRPATARAASVSPGDSSGFYLLLVAAAAAVFVVGQVLGALGVRLR